MLSSSSLSSVFTTIIYSSCPLFAPHPQPPRKAFTTAPLATFVMLHAATLGRFPPQLSHDVATLTKKRYLTKSNATMPSKQRSYSVALLFFRRLNLVVLDLDWWHSFCLFCHLLCIFSTFGIYISIPNCTPNSFAYQLIISMHISNHQTKQKNHHSPNDTSRSPNPTPWKRILTLPKLEGKLGEWNPTSESLPRSSK